MKGKHKGSRNLYIDQRDNELYRAFCKAKGMLMKEKGKIILAEAVEIARTSITTRFFVSEQRASEIIKKMLKTIDDIRDYRGVLNNDALSDMRYQSKRLYANLFITYINLSYEYKTESHEELITRACASPAPEFFLSHKAALILLNNIHLNNTRHGIISSDQTLIRNFKKD